VNLLAVETSSSVAGVAVLRDGKLTAECYLDNRLTHSEVLMPMVERALNLAEINCAELDAFAVDVGPGSFTGVRIGVCAANGMAAALNKPVISVDALSAMAYNFPHFSGLVTPLLDARGDQIYAAAFDTESGEPEPVVCRFAGEITDFIQSFPKDSRMLFLGDGAAAHRELLLSRYPSAAFAPCHLNRPRAGSIAALAELKLMRGESSSSALPLYLRSPQAERMRALREQNG